MKSLFVFVFWMKSIFNIFFLVCFMLSKNSFLFRVYCIIISKCRLGCFVFLRLYWVFIKGAISVSSKQVAVCVILIFKTLHFFVFVCYVLFWACFWLRDFGLFVVVVFVIDFTIDWWDGLSCLFWRFVFWIVLSDCLIWLIVPIGCFLLNGCDFVWKKKNKGLTVHCNVAFVKPYVKTSALWFKRLIFWFGRVLFVVKMLLCSERRFANDEKVKSFAK